MTDTRFTPGPLKIVEKDPNGFYYEISNQKIPEGSASGSQSDWHNAYFNVSGYFGSYGPHMFVAAVEMYAVLEDVFSSLSASDDSLEGAYADLSGEQVQAIADVLAKARGEA